MSDDPITELQRRQRAFTAAHDWEQFPTPKNLAMALAGEVGELLEIFQWLTPEQAAEVMFDDRAADVKDELDRARWDAAARQAASPARHTTTVRGGARRAHYGREREEQLAGSHHRELRQYATGSVRIGGSGEGVAHGNRRAPPCLGQQDRGDPRRDPRAGGRHDRHAATGPRPGRRR